MSTPLLATKLYIPTPRSSLVPRPRLVERLNAGLHRRLTLLSAPAGFGKTTLLSEWIHSRGAVTAPSRVAWLSLDEGDNDPTRFLTYLVAALQTIESDMGQGVLAALHAPGLINIEAVLTALLNELAGLPGKVVLVLDDYHLIESPAIDGAVAFLLEHLPPTVNLVIASRLEPTLPLPRLRARGQLNELRQADLRFSTSEVTALFEKTLHLPISADDVRRLEERTEGWVTGLQLAVLAMQGLGQSEQAAAFVRSFSGSHRYVIDYLVDEVLEQQIPQVQEFLLQTSILDRMVAALCNAVTGRQDGQETLEELEAANLFLIPLDDERRWYRYHHLFAGLLRHRLQQERPCAIPELYRRSSRWHEQNGLVARAIEHALAAGDMEQAASLVEGYYRPALWQGQVTAVLGWLESLPDGLVRSDASLSLGYAWGLFLSGQMGGIAERLQDAETALAVGAGSGDDEQRAELHGEMATLRSYLLRVQGDPVRGIQLAQTVLQQVPEDNLPARGVLLTVLGGLYRDAGDIERASTSFARAIPISQAAGNIMAAVMAVDNLVQLRVMQGQLRQAAGACQRAMESTARLAEHDGQRTLASDVVCVSLASVLYEWNQLDEAEEHLRVGIERSRRGGFFQSMVYGQILLARVLQARGNADGANAALSAAARSARMNPPEWYRRELDACQVHLWLAQGDLDAASKWARESRLGLEAAAAPGSEVEHLALARVLVAQGQAGAAGTAWARVSAWLGRLAEAAEAAGRMGHLIELLLLQALALEAQANSGQAQTSLEAALELAEPQRYVRTLVDKGKAMARLLREARGREFMPDYTSQLLSAFEAGEQGESPLLSKSLVEPLSPRELEVLQLIAQGLSNREISERLYITLSTVKGHNQNIFGKLQVQRRTEAVARARELALV